MGVRLGPTGSGTSMDSPPLKLGYLLGHNTQVRLVSNGIGDVTFRHVTAKILKEVGM